MVDRMNRNTLLLKLFKVNIKKYMAFVMCNMLAISILYSFVSIMDNAQFMDQQIVDPMISSNIYAPTYLVILFTALFIPFTQHIFMKDRQKEYGILLTLGMSEKDVRENIVKEFSLMSILSIGIGFIVGSALSLFFLFYIKVIIGVSKLTLTLSLVAYVKTGLYVIVIFILSMGVNILRMQRQSIREIIVATQEAEVGKHKSLIVLYGGLLLTLIGLILMVTLYAKNSNIWLASILLSIIGSYMVFYNGEAIIKKHQEKSYKRYIKHLFLVTDVKYYYQRNRKMYMASTWIFFSIIFFLMFSAVTVPNFRNNAIIYHPFHLVYATLDDNEHEVNLDMESIAKKNGNEVVKSSHVSFIRNGPLTIFNEAEMNKVFDLDMHTKEGAGVFIYPYDEQDGYEHDLDYEPESISIEGLSEDRIVRVDETIVTPFIGNINAITTRILVVNETDYLWIKNEGIEYGVQGELNMYQFQEWKNSEGLVNEVVNQLGQMDSAYINDRFYQVSARIDAYIQAQQSSEFLIFLMVYVSILLYIAVIIMMHFKLDMEYDSERVKYRSLYRLGTQRAEMKRMLFQKVFSMYFVGFGYAMGISFLFSYYANSSYGYGGIGVGYCLLISTIVGLIHFGMYRRHANKYFVRMTYFS